MELLAGYSLLQQYWIVLLALTTLRLLANVLGGSDFDPRSRRDPPKDTFSITEFRQRPGLMRMLGMFFTLWVLWNIVWAYCLGRGASSWLSALLDTVLTPSRQTSDCSSMVLVVLLFWLTLVQRTHEALSVSIFSNRRSLNIISALMEYSHYIAATLSLIASAPSLTQETACFSLASLLSGSKLFGLAMFIGATHIHITVHKAFVKFRSNKFGHVTTTDYKQPKGGYFEYASCPHYFAEIVIYVSLGVLLGGSCSVWWLCTAVVTLRQLVLAYTTHNFYKQKFDYPQNRKMIVPFIL